MRRAARDLARAPARALHSLREPASLQRWLILAFAAVGVGTAGLILLFLLSALSSSLSDERASEAGRLAALALADAANRQVPPEPSLTDRTTLQGFLDDVAAKTRGEARFVSPSGRTVTSEGTLRVLIPSRPEDATRGIIDGVRAASSTRLTRNGQEAVIAVGPVREDAQLRGALEIAIPVETSDSAVGVVTQRAYFLIIAVLLLSGLVGYRIARVLGRRLGRIAGVAAELAGGDLSARAPTTTPQELTSLSASLNEMAMRLEEQLGLITAESDRTTAMVATLEEAVVLIDAHGRVQRANPTATRLLGIDGTGVVPEHIARWLAPGEAGETEWAGRVLEGEHLIVPASDWSVLCVRDVTAARRLESARRELVANVSHELKTPLAALRGLIEIMHNAPDMPAAQRDHFLDLMDREGQRLTRLVEDQLELARLDADALPLERIPCDLVPLSRRALDSRRELAEAEGIHLHWELAPDTAPIDADPGRIEQILFILLDNALRHTPSGGDIYLHVRAISDRVVHVDVRDTGEGIAAQDVSVVFDRFYQADPSRTGAGAGLGLAIAQGLARAHGGELSVHSPPGEGATFTLTLPRDKSTLERTEDV